VCRPESVLVALEKSALASAAINQSSFAASALNSTSYANAKAALAAGVAALQRTADANQSLAASMHVTLIVMVSLVAALALPLFALFHHRAAALTFQNPRVCVDCSSSIVGLWYSLVYFSEVYFCHL
jgi:hypothetical protein